MKKLFFISVLIGCSCNLKTQDTFYQLIKEKFPQDQFIDRSFEKLERDKQDLIYEKEFYFPHQDQIQSIKEIYERPFLDLHHIYEIQSADKAINEYLTKNKIYEIQNKDKSANDLDRK